MSRSETPASSHARTAPRSVGRAHWDDVGEAWQRERPQRTWRAHSDVVNARLLDRWLPPTARRVLKTDLFDESVGTGLVAGLRSRADRVVGIDIALTTATGARAGAPGVQAVVADVRTLPFREAAFDVIVSTSTLDHFERATDINTSLAELARALRPGGELVVTLDNPSNPLVRLRNALPFGPLRRIGLVPYFVGATLGPRELQAHVRAAGLEVLDTACVLHCPRAPAVALAGFLDRHGSPRTRSWLRSFLDAFELLERLPTRHLTGYFVAVRARRTVHG